MKRNRLFPALLLMLALLVFCTLAAAESNHIHREAVVYTPIDAGTHEVTKYCADPDCGEVLDMHEEEHSFSAGACSKCGYACPHSSKHTESIPVEGENDYKWDGAYLTYTALKITCCETCGQELSREVREERMLHQKHTSPVHISYINENKISHTENLVCSLCGTEYSVTESHKWEQIGCYATDSEETHTVVMHCAQCGALEEKSEKHNTREARWESGKNQTCIQVLQCTACRKEIRTEPVEHLYKTAQWVTGGVTEAEYHKRVLQCSRCSYAIVQKNEPHRMERGVCTVCGYTAKPDHKHDSVNSNEYTAISSTEHYVIEKCRICGLLLGGAIITRPHRYDAATGVCMECGYARDGHPHEVELTYNETLSNDERHVLSGVCRVCGMTVMETGEHTVKTAKYEYLDDEFDLETGICTRCGHTSVKKTRHKWLSENLQYDGETHWQYCRMCKTKMREAKHAYAEMNGKLYCEACEYRREKTAPHEHQLVYSHAIPSRSQRDRCLWVYTCSECGLDFSRPADHQKGGNVEYIQYDEKIHKAKFCCVKCNSITMIEEPHTPENDVCVDCGMHVHVHSFEERRSAVDPHLYYWECRCGKIDREETTPCELQPRYHVLSETQHEFRYECVICGDAKGRSTADHVFVNGMCEACGYAQGTPVPVENDALPIAGAPAPDAEVSVQTDNGGITLRASMLLPWHVLAIDGKAVECVPDISKPEDDAPAVCVLRPENVPEDGIYEMLLTLQQTRDTVASGIGSLRVEINGYEILVLKDTADLLSRMEEQRTEEILIFFCLNPDAPEGARDTDAYLFTSSPFELYNAE